MNGGEGGEGGEGGRGRNPVRYFRLFRLLRLLRPLGLCVLTTMACARMAPPPGGPDDKVPPQLLATVPESVGVYPTWNQDVEFKFDEIISEGSSPNLGLGTGDLERLVLLSPSREVPRIKWKRDRITARPKEGWKPNRVYRIELLPGIVDLRRNRSDTSLVVTFSTGAPLPTDTISGRAVDWVAGKIATNALIGLTLMPDTLVYRTLTDSAGRFQVGPLPHGEYLVFAVLDNNHNLQQESREPFDSVRIAAGTTSVPALWIYPHDSVGPRMSGVTLNDSISATLAFTQPLDPYQRFDSLKVLLRELPDSTPVDVRSLLPKPVDDSLQALLKAHLDSLRADSIAKDTSAARPDTSKRLPAGKVPAPAAPVPIRRPAAAQLDSTEDKRLLGQRPALFDKLILRPAAPFKPDTKFVVEVFGIRNVNGVAGDARAGLNVPAPKPVEEPKDSTAAATDSGRAVPDSSKGKPR